MKHIALLFFSIFLNFLGFFQNAHAMKPAQEPSPSGIPENSEFFYKGETTEDGTYALLILPSKKLVNVTNFGTFITQLAPSFKRECAFVKHLYCNNAEFGDNDLAFINEDFKALKGLYITCDFVTDKGLEAMAKNLKNLEKLSISNTRGVTDAGVQCLVSNLSSLKELSFRYCPNISDASLSSIAQSLKNLSSLDISGCMQLTDKGLTTLVRALPNLQKLDWDPIYDQDAISFKDLESIRAAIKAEDTPKPARRSFFDFFK